MKSFTLYTFGDSILDCGHYNEKGYIPSELVLRNCDETFPEFAGRDLKSEYFARRVKHVHAAVDGSVVTSLPRQIINSGVHLKDHPPGGCAALLTVGGNDLLGRLTVPGLRASATPDVPVADLLEQLRTTASTLCQLMNGNRVLLATVYDPTCGDDARGVKLGLVTPGQVKRARAALDTYNDGVRKIGETTLGVSVVDLHAHFLKGNASWFVNIIEPSLVGASEVRRAFLPSVIEAASL